MNPGVGDLDHLANAGREENWWVSKVVACGVFENSWRAPNRDFRGPRRVTGGPQVGGFGGVEAQIGGDLYGEEIFGALGL